MAYLNCGVVRQACSCHVAQLYVLSGRNVDERPTQVCCPGYNRAVNVSFSFTDGMKMNLETKPWNNEI